MFYSRSRSVFEPTLHLKHLPRGASHARAHTHMRKHTHTGVYIVGHIAYWACAFACALLQNFYSSQYARM